MNDEFNQYLDLIELSSATIKERVELVYRYASKLCPEEIETIFVSDYIKEDGSREYESLFFFSKSFVMEIRDFRSSAEQDIDLAHCGGWISYFRVYLKEYDLVKATHNSRMKLDCFNNDTISFSFKAARNNCATLNSILEKYIKKDI